MIDKTLFDTQLYKLLVEISTIYADRLSGINQSTLQLVKNHTFLSTLKTIENSTRNVLPDAEKFAGVSQTIADSLLHIENRYKELIGVYNVHQLSDNICYALQQIHTNTIFMLSQYHETTMVHDLLTCFAQAKYELLPSVLNKCMAVEKMNASDVALIKTAVIVPVLDLKLKYPRGFKTVLKTLNFETAEEMADNTFLKYDTKKSLFISDKENVSTKELNSVLAGKMVFCYTVNDDEFVTENELISLMAELSITPTLGGLTDTGRKIFEWVKRQFLDNIIINFDKEYYYHSRSRKKEDAPYVPDQMTRAPYGKPGAGRYNYPGIAHYYFADTKAGAEVEVKKHLKKSEEILQTAKIQPIKPIRMLDLSGTLQRGASFLKMLRYDLSDDSAMLPREYLIPCFVADCCKKIGFEGIKYYGSQEYTNYVSWNDGFFSFVEML